MRERVIEVSALLRNAIVDADARRSAAQRWITYRRRLAAVDLLLGPYPALIPALTSKRTARPIGIRINGFVHRRLGGFRGARGRDVLP